VVHTKVKKTHQESIRQVYRRQLIVNELQLYNDLISTHNEGSVPLHPARVGSKQWL